MKQMIRVGLVGCGGIAQSQHLPGYLRTENVEIAALCDVNATLLHRVAEQYGVTACYSDYRELLALPDLDAVDICTAPDSHFPIALAAIEA
ncbi:MAG: Gfo/Idh/MocA family oxidoreductase, partial [Caldilineaceae bacterium]|nr:Gfo/Idh/MocA family oxidoreductase [Caldilineaceae bacterium]